MTAIDILEKLGADSTFNKSSLSQSELDSVIKLNENDDDFAPPLTHECPEDEEQGEDSENR